MGEEIAARHLTASGYRIVDRNFRTRHGELDLVAAKDGETLVFCEVKTLLAARAGARDPLIGIGPDKRGRIRMMARHWLVERSGLLRGRGGDQIRFDAIGVLLDARGHTLSVEHVDDAF